MIKKRFNFRKDFSIFLVNIARKIYPDNPEVKAFWIDLMTERFIFGKNIVKISPLDTEEKDQYISL